jgi:anti-sigma factor RsiW
VISNMTSKFNPHPKFNPSIARPSTETQHDTHCEEDLLWLDDRFELLSAYLDGEVNAEECQQVEAWLETDAAARKLYEQMSNLHQNILSIPVPAPVDSARSLADGVFARLDRQRHRRNWRWGGAIAAGFVAVVSGITLTTRSYSPQMAQFPHAIEDAQPPVALDRNAENVWRSPSTQPETSIVSRALFVE